MSRTGEMVVNGLFNIAGTGGLDTFAWWTEDIGDNGAITMDTTVYYLGGASCKMMAPTIGADQVRVYEYFGVVPGEEKTLAFYTRGDGTWQGRYAVRNVTAGTNIKTTTYTGNITTTWTRVLYSFTVPAACYQISVTLYGPIVGAAPNRYCWFDDVSLRDTYAQLPIIRGFGDTWAGMEELPLTDATMPHGAGRGASTRMILPGGQSYDWGRSDVAPEILPQDIQISGEWIAASLEAMQDKADALNALLGKRSKLWRDFGAGLHQQWRWARCVEVSGDFTPREQLYYAEYTLVFEADSGPWHGTNRTYTIAMSTAPFTLLCPNYGNAPVRDAILTITAGGSNITDLYVRGSREVAGVLTAGLTAWYYSGTIVATKSLIVDADAGTVTNDGDDDYKNLELVPQAGAAQYQAVREWIYLEPGYNALVIDRTGGTALTSLTISYYEGWY